jgi:hypothetical protein
MPIARTGLAVVAILCATAAAGCGSGSSSSATSTTSTGGGPLVSYHRSGGLAYSNLTLTVDSDGHAVAVSKGPTGANRRAFTLPSSQVAKLRRTLDAAPLGKLPKRPNTACADCYLYEFDYGGDTYNTDEASLPPSLKPVIAALDPIAARAIPQSIVPNLSG